MVILIICTILFCSKYYQSLINEIYAIIRAKKNLTQNEEYKKKNNKKMNQMCKTLKSNNSKILNQPNNLIQSLKINKKRKTKKKIVFLQKKRNQTILQIIKS